MRYAIVAEGNISKMVQGLWAEGFRSLVSTVRNDAVNAGRVRPLHWIHHSVPFILSSLRSGDFFVHDPEVALSRRINGDLQTHTAFQVLCVAIYLSALGMLMCTVSGRWWSGPVFIALVAAGGSTLRENLVLNHCDSGEIGQLLYISLYLLSLAPILKGYAPSLKLEVGGIVFLILAYAMKETTVVISPVVAVVLMLRLLPWLSPDSVMKRYVFRHVSMHALLCVVLLVSVWLFRSGEYVSSNYQVAGAERNWADAVLMSWRRMSLPIEVFRVFILSMACLLYTGITVARRRIKGSDEVVACCMLGLLFAGVAAGFFAINVPWASSMSKYYLPSYTFAFAVAVMGVTTLYHLLAGNDLRCAAYLLVVGVTASMVRMLPAQYENIERYYMRNYNYRKAVPIVTEDLAGRLRDDAKHGRVAVVSRTYFPEGGLSFWRTLNRYYRFNIATDEGVVSSLNAVELSYFRRYEERPSVNLVLLSRIQENDTFDIIYIIGAPDDTDLDALKRAGFVASTEWVVGRTAIPVMSFTRQGAI